MNKNIGSFEKVFDFFSRENPYEEAFSCVLCDEKDQDSIKKYIELFNLKNKNTEKLILSLSRKQITEILCSLPEILKGVDPKVIRKLVSLRCRRYVFRILYVLWQDYYEDKNIVKLFLDVIYETSSKDYISETGFTQKELSELVVSVDPEGRVIEFARSKDNDMKEFLEKHNISRKSMLGMNCLSIFFLFCSPEDYMYFGEKRLICAIERFDIANQARIASNMAGKADSDDLKNLKGIFAFFKDKYPEPYGDDGIFYDYLSDIARNIIYGEKPA